jgi:gluconokinase
MDNEPLLPPPSNDIPLFIIGGPAGCGKSTIARTIANYTHYPFIEGDDLHPPQNIAKMSSGHPLVDADRWDWLDTIIETSVSLSERSPRPHGIVITCSSLKRSYRDRMRERVREAKERGTGLREWFVFCKLSQEESLRRVQGRPGHFMKAGMVASQFRDLEVPDPEREERVFVLDVERSVAEVDKDVIEFVKRCIGENANGEHKE